MIALNVKHYVSDVSSQLRIGDTVETNGSGSGKEEHGEEIKGIIGAIDRHNFYIYQNVHPGSEPEPGRPDNQYRTMYLYSWTIQKDNDKAFIIIKERTDMSDYQSQIQDQEEEIRHTDDAMYKFLKEVKAMKGYSKEDPRVFVNKMKKKQKALIKKCHQQIEWNLKMLETLTTKVESKLYDQHGVELMGNFGYWSLKTKNEYLTSIVSDSILTLKIR